MRGDARRQLLSRLVVDHRLTAGDPFTMLSEDEGGIAERLLRDEPSSMSDVAGLLAAA
jgi:acyl-CoA dehydrogenase